MPPVAGSVRRCWGTDSTLQLQVEPHYIDWIYWMNGILLQYIPTLTQVRQSTELAQGGSVTTPAED